MTAIILLVCEGSNYGYNKRKLNMVPRKISPTLQKKELNCFWLVLNMKSKTLLGVIRLN